MRFNLDWKLTYAQRWVGTTSALQCVSSKIYTMNLLTHGSGGRVDISLHLLCFTGYDVANALPYAPQP